MNENIVVLNKENMISAFGITINDDYNIKFEPDSQAIDITSRFFIESHASPYSDAYIASDNFENTDTPGFVALLPTILSKEGVVTLKLTTESPYIKDIMTLVNHYVKFFMVINSTVVLIAHRIHLEIMADYILNDSVTIGNVKILNLVLNSPYESNIQMKDRYIQDEVNAYLSKIGIDEININTDIDNLMELVKRQLILDCMVKI